MIKLIEKILFVALLACAGTSFSATISAIQVPGLRVNKRELSKELVKTEFSTPIYQLLSLVRKDKPTIFARCNMFTGVGRILKDGEYEIVGEPEPRPRSNYSCTLVADGDNGWLFYRIDRITGKTWRLDGKMWRLVREE